MTTLAPPDIPAPTATATLDAAIEALRARRASWAREDVAVYLQLLERIAVDLAEIDEEWVRSSLAAKGVPPGGFEEAEEWMTLAAVHRFIRILRTSLRDIARHGRPQLPGEIEEGPGGRLVAPVFPHDLGDRVLLAGVTGEVWSRPGISRDAFLSAQASRYADPAGDGGVALILGGGNVSVIPPGDVLYRLFVLREVALLKMHPANAYLGPLLERGFRALVEAGALRVVYGGAEVGEYLCGHPGVDSVHMTGGERTLNAIVFGTGEEGERRRAQRAPRLTKPITAELGNVNPVIVVPGPWSADDVRAQAWQVASWLTSNAGFVCMAPRVVVQHRAWPQRLPFADALQHALGGIGVRPAYYPGATDWHGRFLDAHPDAVQLGAAAGGCLPWTFIRDVDPSAADEVCFEAEPFCGLISETALDAGDTVDFLDRAVDFVNERLWGDLSASLLVHPDSMADPGIAAAVERAVAGLRQGTVCINLFPAYAYLLMLSPWGAPPGNDLYEPRSGFGGVNNGLMLEQTEKTIYRAPFRRIDPLVRTASRPLPFARRYTAFQRDPRLSRLPGVLGSALRSHFVG